MPFAKKVKPAEATTLAEVSSTVTSHPPKDLKRFQRESIRARKRLEEVSSRLDDARSEYERVSREAVADGNLDITAVAATMTQAQDNVSAFEAALKIALQQDEEAGEKLKLAAMDAQREVLREHLVKLSALGRQVDEVMNHVARVVDKLIPVLNDTRALGFAIVNSQLTSANLLFKIKLLESCKAMPNCAQPESWFLKPEPWSASLPTPDQADHAR